jgi:hypothetical protein
MAVSSFTLGCCAVISRLARKIQETSRNSGFVSDTWRKRSKMMVGGNRKAAGINLGAIQGTNTLIKIMIMAEHAVTCEIFSACIPC